MKKIIIVLFFMFFVVIVTPFYIVLAEPDVLENQANTETQLTEESEDLLNEGGNPEIQEGNQETEEEAEEEEKKPWFLVAAFKSILTYIYGFTSRYSNYGWGFAIIIFTIITKVLLLPLTFKQLESQKKMQQLQPEIKSIQEKYKKDKEKLNKKTMELYQQHKVNPVSGCLPLLIQLPIIFALFAVIRNIDFGGEGFYWIRDLSRADAYIKTNLDGAAIEPYFNGLYILPVLAVVTQFFAMKMLSTVKGEANPAAEGMMGGKGMKYFFPIFSGYLCMTFPAGLALYWVAQNIFQIAQQYFIKPATTAKGKEGAKQ